jgi:hypothetical protein
MVHPEKKGEARAAPPRDVERGGYIVDASERPSTNTVARVSVGRLGQRRFRVPCRICLRAETFRLPCSGLTFLIRRLVACTAFLSVAATSPLHGQSPSPWTDYWLTRSWVGDVTFLSANALLAGVSAGVLQELRDGSFKDGFARGALGGAVSYGGRRLAVADFWGAGLVGRQVSAVGNSLARNAAQARPSLYAVWLPLGPVTVRLSRENGFRATAKPDIFAAGWLLAAILDDELELDVGTSLSSGAPVFRAPHHVLRFDGQIVGGLTPAGVIVVGNSLSIGVSDGEILRHERVHVLQYDFAQMMWGDPLEEGLAQHVPYARTLNNYVRFGVTMPGILAGLVQVFNIDLYDHPWEVEAFYLAGR